MCLLFCELYALYLIQRLTGITIPVILYIDQYKLLYAIGNIAGPSSTPGTPGPGESFVTVYFRITNVNANSVTLELLFPCGGREIDPVLLGVDGVPVSEIVKDGELYLVRTNQSITISLNEIEAVQSISTDSVVPSCPL